MGGKAYPYASKDITLIILDQIKALAAKNLSWNYTFGPELYQDMIHVGSQRAMNNQRNWMRIEKTIPFKRNIIWDTKAMYNDMLNDPTTKYWCYRNKVEHTKIISISGKAKCLCCNNDISPYNIDNDEYDEDYNNRYENTDNAVCEDCLDTKFYCKYCYSKNPIRNYTKITNSKFICEDCVKRYIRKCPCCGEAFYVNYNDNLNDYGIFYNKIFFEQCYDHKEWMFNNNLLTRESIITAYGDISLREEKEFKPWAPAQDVRYSLPIESLYLCPRCMGDRKLVNHLRNYSIKVSLTKDRMWSYDRPIKTRYIINPEIGKKFRFPNLKKGTVEELREAELRKKSKTPLQSAELEIF